MRNNQCKNVTVKQVLQSCNYSVHKRFVSSSTSWTRVVWKSKFLCKKKLFKLHTVHWNVDLLVSQRVRRRYDFGTSTARLRTTSKRVWQQQDYRYVCSMTMDDCGTTMIRLRTTAVRLYADYETSTAWLPYDYGTIHVKFQVEQRSWFTLSNGHFSLTNLSNKT